MEKGWNTERIHRIRYPDPTIKVNDTVKIDLATGKITDFIKFDTGVIAMVTGGRNMGRVGVITHRERHDGGFNIVHIKDAVDNEFATREGNVFIIGREKPWISLPKGKGVKVSLGTIYFRKLKLLLTRNLSFPLRRREIAVGPMLLLATKCRAERVIGEVKDENGVQDCIGLVTWSLCCKSRRMEMLDEARSSLQNSMPNQIKKCLGRIYKHS